MKKLLYFSVAIIIFLIAAVIFLYSHHPLQIGGHTVIYNEAVIIEIKNKGISDIQLENVIVPNPEQTKVEIGVSYSMQLVIGSGLNQGRTFENLSAQTVHPELTFEQKIEAIEKGQGTPIHYGIRINDSSVKEVMIQYRYLGLRYTETIEIN